MTINELPFIHTQTIAVKVTKKAERKLHQKHPWIFDQSIVKQSKEGKCGDTAIIYAQKSNRLLAVGLWDEDSPIRIKVIAFFKTTLVNKQWFQEVITTALKKRAPLLNTNTNAYRLVFGENDGMPGFIADVYENVLVIKLYTRIWLPYLKNILNVLRETIPLQAIVLRLSRRLQKAAYAMHGLEDGTILWGTLPDPTIIFNEHGIRFSANVINGHKTGYFLDHRENRRKVGKLAKDKKVLDVFSYAGGFSVHALAGGATSVTSIDISKQALLLAKENADLNYNKATHLTMAIDAFKGLENLIQQKNVFDIVVIDPPAFAKKESEISKAILMYKRLVTLGVQLVRTNGILVMASCSSRIANQVFYKAIEETLRISGRQFSCLEKTFHDIDHPVTFPEGAYLKTGYYQFKS